MKFKSIFYIRINYIATKQNKRLTEKSNQFSEKEIFFFSSICLSQQFSFFEVFVFHQFSNSSGCGPAQIFFRKSEMKRINFTKYNFSHQNIELLIFDC